MAKNVGGRRIGAIRGRTQFKLPSGHYAKVDRRTGEILSVKADRKPYKNVVITAPPSTPAPVARAQTAGKVGLPALRRRRTRRLPEVRPVSLARPSVARRFGPATHP